MRRPRPSTHLVYSNFAMATKQAGHAERFQAEHNGFSRVDLPRYYVPLACRSAWPCACSCTVDSLTGFPSPFSGTSASSAVCGTAGDATHRPRAGPARTSHIQMKDQMLIARPDDPILITGATGFIGKRVVRSLLDRGFRNLRCLLASVEHGAAARRNPRRRPCGDAARQPVVARGLRRGNEGRRGDLSTSRPARGEKSFPDAFMNSVVTTRNLLDAARPARLPPAFRQHQLVRRLQQSRGNRSGGLLDEECPVEAAS